MARTIITHVGTSLLSCDSIEGVDEKDRLQGDVEGSVNIQQWTNKVMSEMTTQLTKRWGEPKDSSYKTRHKDSPAEISSLSLLDIRKDDKIVLLHSHTSAGLFCASILRELLINTNIAPDSDFPYCGNVSIKNITGLSISGEVDTHNTATDAENFVRLGIKNYVNIVYQQYKESLRTNAGSDDFDLVFNITGGYKGMIPIARDMALLLTAHNRTNKTEPSVICDVCYVFQSNDRQGAQKLIRYPAFPFIINWSNVIPRNLRRMFEDAAEGTLSELRVARPVNNTMELLAEYRPYFEAASSTKFMRLTPLGEVIWTLYNLIGKDYPSAIDPHSLT